MQRAATLAFLSLLVCPVGFASVADTDSAWSCATELSGANPARIFAEQTAKVAKFAFADPDRATHVAKILAEANYEALRVPTWDYPPYPDRKMPMTEAIRFLLVVDALNYRYVTDDGLAEFAGDGLKGAGLLVQRVLENWDVLSNPMTLARLTVEDVERIFKADVPLPDLEARKRHLNEVGVYLLQTPDCGHESWLQKHKTPVGLAMHLARAIPGFREPFLKRAQLFVGMVIGRFRNAPGFPAAFTHAGELTVYADYVLPSILYRMGIVRYTPELEAKIRRGVALEANSREEMEIRAATIVGADALDRALKATNAFPDVSVLGLDFALWIQAKEIDIPDTEMPASVFVRAPIRYHRATTTAY